MEDKRLIEVDFPLKEVSDASAMEKSVRHGHISTLHIWWARRPLAASRAIIYSSLIPVPENYEALTKELKFISELSEWRNSLNNRLIRKAKKEIASFFKGKTPKVLDCFAGGGAIPLEALRLGCETSALEYNPVAVLILKATLEYPQRFGRGKAVVKNHSNAPISWENPLIKDIQHWGDWILAKAKLEIDRFYPKEKNGCIPVGFIWNRTMKCQNPSCGAEIPLTRNLWLSKNEKKKTGLRLVLSDTEKKIDFDIVKGSKAKFDEGTIKRGTILCPICKSANKASTTQKLAQEGKIGERLVAVILHHENVQGKSFRIATKEDLAIFHEASDYLGKKAKEIELGIPSIPDEELPYLRSIFNVHVYGIRTWGDLFNARQKLALLTFVEAVRKAYAQMLTEGYSEDYAKAITTYLALAVDRLTTFNSSLSWWQPAGEFGVNLFVRQALGMIWDYFELNPFSNAGGDWKSAINWILRVVNHCISSSDRPADVRQGTATRLPYKDGSFDVVFIDPPYYDNVPYADLSDFFYVWLKRTIGDIYPELLSTPLSPKTEEIVQLAERNPRYQHKTKEFFETELTKAFKEITRVLNENGIAIIVFAHKSTDAWETIINSLLASGLVLTASWPLHTERRNRLRAKESAALASSVYMICRKRLEKRAVYFNEIKEEIEKRIGAKLTQFWEQGISGADFFVSSIGPAVEVFGKYSQVEKLSGETVTVQELLEYVRKIVSEFALERVLKRADLGGVDSETRFYLIWRWAFNNSKVHFDDAIKLSRPMGIELTQLWTSGGFVRKENEFVRVLDPKERAKDHAFLRKAKFTSIIDVLHYVLILWEKSEKEKIQSVLNETGFAGNEIFWQTAQAISEILPQGDKEKQLLQGFLYGREAYIKEATKGNKTLLDFTERE